MSVQIAHNEKMIARRVKGGANEAEARELLAELVKAHSGDNLVYALVYNGFATEAYAAKVVAFA